MKITTKTGDKGETSLFGGRRVSKASVFIELVGGLDELQAVVGWCRCGVEDGGLRGLAENCPANCMTKLESGLGDELVELLGRVQDDLYRMMSVVGFEMKCPGNIRAIGEEDVAVLEKYVEAAQAKLGDLSKFIRPGTTEMAARLHIARTVCRRVEREFVRKGCFAMRAEGGDGGRGRGEMGLRPMLKYLNRLSDVLFVMAYGEEKFD